uniref:3-oxoacyl-[acyl-carrier-protein] reductase n=1 Tax=Candidatus Kentrum sp. SD TaxID=2126332 RepID=A0A451BL79_9GAMM|nr:MAG: 3-oxoacyl-[acyl-carrier-protein] reductase [Candidatus Kentron sp. SD]VFK44582.1 MAG: 3-oxoacyl-[acyl-carrier-protein] reductase [Candidatus Kentron sp. SD]VFK79024.1 MAG: 3-oxoacyl-[acyl-carrier-protein] reductase [Candidatus Kentron sp. SD]
MSLTDEVALVTGASRGIGKAIADMLGSQGSRIIGTSTTDDGAAGITRFFAEQNIEGYGEVLDIADSASVDALFSRLATNALLPTILVNNAGIARDGLLLRMKQEDWDLVINTNLTSLYRMCRACARLMGKMRKGRIINITSVSGALGNAGQINYSAAKAGIVGFTKALARELAPRGITVNAVSPGIIDTDMVEKLSSQQREMVVSHVPLGRIGQVEDVAAAVAYLASSGAGYVTGTTLHVNGGMYMG